MLGFRLIAAFALKTNANRASIYLRCEEIIAQHLQYLFPPLREELLPKHEVVCGGVLHERAVQLPRVGRREDADPALSSLELFLRPPHDLDLLARQPRVAQTRPVAVGDARRGSPHACRRR